MSTTGYNKDTSDKSDEEVTGAEAASVLLKHTNPKVVTSLGVQYLLACMAGPLLKMSPK